MENDTILENMKYPVGKFQKPEVISTAHLQEWIREIEKFPDRLRKLIENLSEDELNWEYRPGSWSIRQVVHHCADSHMNSFTRFKLTLTEETPSIKPYFEDRWAELPDATIATVDDSLNILRGIHSRWVVLLRSLTGEDLKREYFHPERGIRIVLEENIGFYAWHSNHHLAHVKQAINHKGSFEN
jgi:uncharacterized damage-inducible protein DinB